MVSAPTHTVTLDPLAITTECYETFLGDNWDVFYSGIKIGGIQQYSREGKAYFIAISPASFQNKSFSKYLAAKSWIINRYESWLKADNFNDELAEALDRGHESPCRRQVA